MRSVDQLLEEAGQLPQDQRLSLAHRLLTATEPEPSPSVDEAWDMVIRERLARYDRGEARSHPASEVFARIDRELQA